MPKKRTLVKIISYTAAAFVAVCGFAVLKNAEANRFKTTVVNGYAGSLNRVSEGIDNIRIMLEKGAYANSATQFSTLSASIMREAGTAKAAMAELPLTGGEYAAINRFLSQVGDYSLYLSKKVISGKKPGDDERKSWVSLSEAAAKLSTGIGDLRSRYEEYGVWDSEITARVENELNISQSMLEIEEALTDTPTLIYDGPFSDHILTSTPKMTENAKEVTRDHAREKAAAALGVDTSALKDDGDENGVMSCYCFTSGNTSIAITKKGGFIVYFRKYREMGDAEISYEQAVAKATEFLGKYDVTVKESYYFADEGICTVNFAHREGSVICYPDLIKVGVALDTGEILSVEARGYIMNHHTRTVPTPKYSEEEAGEAVSKNLTVEKISRAIIPTTSKSEVSCYELLCKGTKGEDILVYLSTDTLEEENILLLLHTDGGTLAK